jgi:Flp pilus assembly pilin Flp
MRQALRGLWREEEGQDLIEYTLLLAFMLLCSLAMIGFGSDSMKGILSTSNSQVALGNKIASGG